MQQLVFASVFGSNCPAVFFFIIFLSFSAVQLRARCRPCCGGVSVPRGRARCHPRTLLTCCKLSQVRLLGPSGRCEQLVCRDARERRNHCAERNSLCHDPRQLRLFPPPPPPPLPRPSFGLQRWMCVHHYCHACPISG